MDATARTEAFNCHISGVATTVSLTIKATYEASLAFSLHGSPYSFTIARWSRRGFAKFATLFFNYAARDPIQFGTFSESPDGVITFGMTTDQKLNIITQGVRDIMACLDAIVIKYKRSVLDYAVWYREKYPRDEPYDNFITLYTCHCIAHSNFLAPDISWDVVVQFGQS